MNELTLVMKLDTCWYKPLRRWQKIAEKKKPAKEDFDVADTTSHAYLRLEQITVFYNYEKPIETSSTNIILIPSKKGFAFIEEFSFLGV